MTQAEFDLNQLIVIPVIRTQKTKEKHKRETFAKVTHENNK